MTGKATRLFCRRIKHLNRWAWAMIDEDNNILQEGIVLREEDLAEIANKYTIKESKPKNRLALRIYCKIAGRDIDNLDEYDILDISIFLCSMGAASLVMSTLITLLF
jgi:hypothetical protein